MKKVTPDKAMINKAMSVILISLICCFALIILLQVSSVFFGPSKGACNKQVCLAKFMEGPPSFNDENLKNYLLKKYFVQSSGPLNLAGNIGADSGFDQTMEFVKSYFDNKREGRFAVMGAGDGEYQDITLALEKELNWSGLLVEPNPTLFEQLKSKGRNAMLSSNCVSPYAYPAKIKFGHQQPGPNDGEKEKFEKMRFTKIAQLWKDESGPLTEMTTQCIPAENLLYAGGIESNLDLLVLSMSGTDLDMFMNVQMNHLPKIKMIVLSSYGNDITDDTPTFFYDLKLSVKKVIDHNNNRIYILTNPSEIN